MINYKKVYVCVWAEFSVEGKIRPVCVIWKDGEKYYIDKVIKITSAPSKTGSLLAEKYVCRFGDKTRDLFYIPHERKWFVEISFENNFAQ